MKMKVRSGIRMHIGFSKQTEGIRQMTKIRSQDQLLDAAEKVFSQKGYDATRLEDIAAELGVLQGSLYYHIESKAGLLRLLRRRRMSRVIERMSEVASSDDSPREKLRRAVYAQMRAL